MLARRIYTREWWDAERKQFRLWASTFGEAELEAGQFPKQRECLKMVRRLDYLPVTAGVKELRDELLKRGLVPPTKVGDAGHLAISASHGIDHLLTWNYAHMANPGVQDRLNALCDERELVAPAMVSPESIPQDRFGQAIRRDR